MRKNQLLDELQERISYVFNAGGASINEGVLLEAEIFKKLKDGVVQGIRQIKQFVQDHTMLIFLVLAILSYILYGEKVLKLIRKSKGNQETFKKDIAELSNVEKVDLEVATKRKIDFPKVYKEVNTALVDAYADQAKLEGFNLSDLKRLGLDNIINVEAIEGFPDEVKVTYRSYRASKKKDITVKNRKVFNPDFIDAVAEYLKEKNAEIALLSPKRRVLLKANGMNPVVKNLDRSYKLVTAATRRFAKMASLNSKEKETLTAKVVQHFNYILQQEGLMDNNTVAGKPVEDFEHAISGIKKDIINIKTKKFS